MLDKSHKNYEDLKRESKLRDLRSFSNKTVAWLFFYFNRQEDWIALTLY